MADILSTLFERINNEIKTDKRVYLLRCRENYSEYVDAARTLFVDVYEEMAIFDSQGDAWTRFNSRIKLFRDQNDVIGEIKMLEEAISKKVYTPATYDRLASLYEKSKDFQSAYDTCKKWFDSDFWKIPNMATGSLRLLDRLERLEKKLKNIESKK